MNTKKTYVGNCKNSFDEDGDCVVPQLGFRDVSELGYADEMAKRISLKDFTRLATIPAEILQDIKGHDVEYMSYNDMLILYDVDSDTHYFFV